MIEKDRERGRQKRWSKESLLHCHRQHHHHQIQLTSRTESNRRATFPVVESCATLHHVPFRHFQGAMLISMTLFASSFQFNVKNFNAKEHRLKFNIKLTKMHQTLLKLFAWKKAYSTRSSVCVFAQVFMNIDCNWQ